MQNVEPFSVERPWGNFRQFTHDNLSTVKIIEVKPNQKNSWQSHEKRAEFWHVIGGSGIIKVEDKEYNVAVGDECSVAVGAKHRFIAGGSGLTLLEIAVGDFDEEDITRYEDDYGRA